MATLKLNSQTVVTESSGTITAPAMNITTGTFNGTVGASATFPKGVSSGVNFLFRLLTSGSSLGGTLGGTGTQLVTFDTIKNGTEDSAFTQNILSLSSNYWTMNTGYYIWDYNRPTYGSDHSWIQGIRTYGDSSGSGTTVGDITTNNVNFGSTFYYVHPTAKHAMVMINSGVLKVTSTNQKHGFYQYVETDSQHSSGAGGSHGSTHNLIQNSLRFIKIGDV